MNNVNKPLQVCNECTILPINPPYISLEQQWCHDTKLNALNALKSFAKQWGSSAKKLNTNREDKCT